MWILTDNAGQILRHPMARLPKTWTPSDSGPVRDYDQAPPERIHADGWRPIGDRPPVEWWQTARPAMPPGDPDAPGIWIVEPLPLDDVRAIQKQRLADWETSARAAGCPVTIETDTGPLAFRVDCRPDDVLNWTAGNSLFDMTGQAPIPVRGWDNVTRHLTPAQYDALVVQVGAFVAGLMGRRWQIKDRIAAAADVAAVVAITFDEETA